MPAVPALPAVQPGFALTLELPESDRFFGDKIDILELNGLSQASHQRAVHGGQFFCLTAAVLCMCHESSCTGLLMISAGAALLLPQSEEYILRPDQAPSTTMLAFLRLLNLSGGSLRSSLSKLNLGGFLLLLEFCRCWWPCGSPCHCWVQGSLLPVLLLQHLFHFNTSSRHYWGLTGFSAVAGASWSFWPARGCP